MASLQGFPEEILQFIVQDLTPESLFCFARTCRTFKRLSYDYRRPAPKIGGSRYLYNPGRGIRDGMKTSVDMFNPPPEYMPPWPANGQLAGFFHIGYFASELRTGDMALHSLGYDIYDDNDRNLPLSNIAGLVLKDSLCSPCWDLRGTPEFLRRLQSQMRPRYCAGCKLNHAGALFDSGRRNRNLCRGWTGRIRICVHKTVTWKEYQRKTRFPQYNCKVCRTTFNAAGEHIRQVVPLASLRQGQSGQEDLNSNGHPTSLHAVLAKCDQAVCPHYQVNDPTLQTYLLHTIRRSYPAPELWAQCPWIEAPLVDCWDKPWNCPICKASFLVRYARSKDDEPRNNPLNIRLVVTRPVLKSLANPSDSRWLSQLEPLSPAARASDAKGVTWCDDASCGTSRQGRKEALLIRMLELGVAPPTPGPPTWPTMPGERSRWLWFAFRWFWTHETEEMQREWRLVDKRENDVSWELFGVRWSSPGVSLRCNWDTAAVLHAAMLYDGPVTRSASAMAAAVTGVVGMHEAYFRGRRPSMRDAVGCRIAAGLLRVFHGLTRFEQLFNRDPAPWIVGFRWQG